MHDDDRRRAARAARRARRRCAPRRSQEPEHGLTAGRARRHRRAHLVGPHRPRRGRRRGRRPRAGRGPGRDGPAGAALGPLLEALQARCSARAAACAGATPASASWCGRSRPSHPIAARRPAPDRDRGAGDVRRALRHPRSPTSSCSSARSRAARCSAAAAASRAARGRIFYFSPGDQEYPVYHHPDVRRVLANAVRWAAPRPRRPRGAPARRSRRAAGSSGELPTRSRDRPAARRGRRRGLSRSALGLRAASSARRRRSSRWVDLVPARAARPPRRSARRVADRRRLGRRARRPCGRTSSST